MSNYEKQNFVSGQILKAEHLNHMEDEIGQLSEMAQVETRADGIGPLVEIAESYFNVAFDPNDQIIYKSGHGLYAENVKYEGAKSIVCSQFVQACIAAIDYDHSRYVQNSNQPRDWGFVSDGSGDYSYTGWDPNNDYMDSGNMAKYFEDHGQLHKFDKDRNALQPGDLLFFTDEKSDKYKKMQHVAICLGASPYRYTIMHSTSGRERFMDGVQTGVYIESFSPRGSYVPAFYARSPICAEYKVQRLLRKDIAKKGSYPEGGNTAWITSLIFDEPLPRGMYTIRFDDASDSKVGYINIKYVNSEELQKFDGNKNAGICPVVFYAESPVSQIDVRVSDGESRTFDSTFVELYKGYHGDTGAVTANAALEVRKMDIEQLSEKIAACATTPESFGAVGDGIADDTDAVRQALLTGVCHLSKQYRITARIDIPNDCTMTGNGTLIVDSATFGIVFTGKRIAIENIKVVIAPNLLYYAFWLRECTDVRIAGVTVTGQEIMPCGMGFDVFRCEECDVVHVSDTSIKDIGMYTDYKVSSDKGNVTGINFRFCKYVEVNNFFAANLHNYDDEGNYYLDDSDALFCSGVGTVFHVTNSTFIEAGKRAIKTACDNILIDNCYIYTSTEDSFTGLGFNHVSDGRGGEYPITSALVNNCTIVNHHTSGYTYCMVSAPGNVNVNNCRFVAHHDLWGCCVIDTNGASVTYSDCVFDGDFFAGDSDQVFRDCSIRNVVWPGYGTGKITFHNTACKNVETGAVVALDSIFDKIHCKDDSELTNCLFYGLATFDNYAMLKHCRSKTAGEVSLLLNGGAYIDDFDAGEESKSIGVGFSGDGETLKFKEVDLNKNLISKSNVSTQKIKTVPYFVEHFPPTMYSHTGMMVQSMQDMRYYRYNGVSWSVVISSSSGDGPSVLDNSQLDYFILS